MIKYRPEIDGLRAVAVIPVVLYHAGFTFLSGGYLGVDVFFVVSGYLITSIIAREMANGSFSIARFYERRIRRIIPLLLLVMFASSGVAFFLLLPSHMTDFSESIVSVLLFLSNIHFWREGGYFAVASELKPLLHTWTLAVEEQFYVLFPVFMLLFWRLGVTWLLSLIAIIACTSLLLAQWGSSAHPDAAFYLLPTRGWELLAGSAVALASLKGKSWNGSNLLSGLGLLMIVGSFVFFESTTPTPSVYTLLPVLGTVLIIMFCSQNTYLFKLLSQKFVVAVGLISYSAYLWHQPILVFPRHIAGLHLHPALSILLIFLVFAVSYFSWRFIETPFRNPDIVGRKPLYILTGGLSALLAAFAFVGIGTSGFLSSYNEADRRVLSSSINATDYMLSTFNSIRLQGFDPNNQAPRVVVIGDSFAQDVVNAISESALYHSFQFSTYRISGRCGNLYLERDFTHYISEHDLAMCRSNGWYDNPELEVLLEGADQVWLASSWQDWNARLLPMSVERLVENFDVEVVVFGTKGFGDFDLRGFLELTQGEWLRHSTDVPSRVSDVNAIIREGLDNTQFIDISDLLCPNSVCPTMTPDGALLTFDGTHLTRSGAMLLGRLLEGEISVD